MDFSQTLDFIHHHSVAALSTSFENKPTVRMVWTAGADPQGVLFHTSVQSSLHRHLSQNPWAEFCFADLTKGRQVRLRGQCIPVEDPTVKEHLISTRDFLRTLEAHWGHREFFQVYRLETPEVQHWSMGDLGKTLLWHPWNP